MIDIDNTKPEDYQGDREPDMAEYASDKYSECCGAMIYSDTDICSDCKEHADEQGADEQTPEQENAWLRDMGF